MTYDLSLFTFSNLRAAQAELAPTGVLVAAINLGNPLLVTGRDEHGQPTGIAPDMAALAAQALGVKMVIKSYEGAGKTADAINECGIVLIAAEPQRAETIAFSPPYVRIEATYMVREEFPATTIADVDKDNITIITSARSAYDLWLTRHIAHAQIKRIEGVQAAMSAFQDGHGDALAGLRPALLAQLPHLPKTRVMTDSFSTVQQAIGTARANLQGAAFLTAFIQYAATHGMIEEILTRHNAPLSKIYQQ